jgi:hypothetical protein
MTTTGIPIPPARRKFVGKSPETVRWIQEQLGIDPDIVRHVTIEIDVTQAAMITVELFARIGDFDALSLADVEEEAI